MARRPKKGKSNSLLLRNLIKNMDNTQLALVRERLLKIAEMTLQDMKDKPHIYKNSIISPGLLESYGKKKYTDAIYEGELLNGKREGNGIMTYISGRKYEGNWKNDLREGKGKEKYISGNTYEGDYSYMHPDTQVKCWASPCVVKTGKYCSLKNYK